MDFEKTVDACKNYVSDGRLPCHEIYSETVASKFIHAFLLLSR